MAKNKIDINAFFDQDAYSDLTVKFGNHEIKCHKVILCTSSEWFKNVYATGKSFSESSEKFIELKDDDEDAVLAMLRWLYCFDYENEETGAKPDQFQFHAQVYIVSDKYLVPRLRDEAYKRLKAYVEALDDDKLVKIIGQLFHDSGDLPDKIKTFVLETQNARMHKLLQHDEYRMLLAELGTDAVFAALDTLWDKDGNPTFLDERLWWRCSYCTREGMKVKKDTLVRCPFCGCGDRFIETSMWVRK